MRFSSPITSDDHTDHGIQFSILTVNYKSGKYRATLLESLREYTKNYEYLEHSNDVQNLGYAKATNKLIRKSKGKYIILLNPDSKVTEDWVDELRKAAESDQKIGIVVPKLLRANNVIDSTGHDYNKWPYAIGNRGEGELDRGQYDKAIELVSSSFGCALIKRELVKKIGLLDERFFLYYEDVEYCHRARKSGWRVVYCPNSVVYHERRGSGHNKWIAESRRYLPYILRKYYPKGVLASWYLWKIKATIAGLRNRDLVYASSNFRAIVDGVW
jgi:GT2 family glycosyltransferase